MCQRFRDFRDFCVTLSHLPRKHQRFRDFCDFCVTLSHLPRKHQRYRVIRAICVTYSDDTGSLQLYSHLLLELLGLLASNLSEVATR